MRLIAIEAKKISYIDSERNIWFLIETYTYIIESYSQKHVNKVDQQSKYSDFIFELLQSKLNILSIIGELQTKKVSYSLITQFYAQARNQISKTISMTQPKSSSNYPN